MPVTRRTHPAASIRRRGTRRWLPLLLLVAVGCGSDPGERIPEGWTLAGRAGDLVPVLDRLERLERSPIARESAALRSRLADCNLFLARCEADPAQEQEPGRGPGEPACRLAETARCVDSLPAWAEELRGQADWFLGHRTGEGLWFLAAASSEDDGSVALQAEVGPVGVGGPISLALPAAELAGPVRLADSEAFVHLRVRPDGGLNLARFVEGEGWGARMYQLRSDLFEGRALAGVWELAVYPPREGELIPRTALALDVRDRGLAVRAMEVFLSDLEETWPVRRAPLRIEGYTGACLSNARVLPDLTPCYIATDDALVVGWNPQSLERALQRNGAHGPGDRASGGRVDFSRFPAVDALIAEASGAPAPAPPSIYPWSALELSGVRSDHVYRFEARLQAR